MHSGGIREQENDVGTEPRICGAANIASNCIVPIFIILGAAPRHLGLR